MKHFVAVILLSLTLTACGQNSPPSPARLLDDYSVRELDSIFNQANETYRTQELDSLIRHIFTELNGTALVMRGKEVLVRETSGYIRFYENKKGYETWSSSDLRNARNRKENRLQPGTFYELASVSKQFTAVAVLKLVEEGYVKLTDSLYRFYPELPYKNVTVHQLLSHTSGLPEYFDFPVSYFDTSHLLSNQELIAIMAERKPPVLFQPGYNYKYTNTNYALLAAIVEKVADINFEEYVRQNIFLPAGMTRTFYRTQLDDQENCSVARGHLKNKQEVKPHYLDGTIGDKGVYSTPEELYKWKVALFDRKKIISESSLRKATSKQNYIRGKGKAKEIYGYGFRIEENPALGKLIYHGGLWKGYQNIMVYRESDDTLIIFLSNCRNGAHQGRCDEILQTLEGA